MIKVFFIWSFLVVIGVISSDEDYIDPVIDMLLNGVSSEITDSPEDSAIKNDEEPVIVGGIWKCGNCTDLQETRLVHSETNQVDADIDNQNVDVQISLVVAGMRCVTVTADLPGAVRKVLGTCEGSSVTLSVSSSHNFTILVYS